MPCRSAWVLASAKRNPEARCWPAYGAIDGLERFFCEHAVVAYAFHSKQPSIGRKTDFAQLRQIVQAFAGAEAVGVVDGRLGAQGPILLVILLDVRLPVVDVQGRRNVLVVRRDPQSLASLNLE